MRGWLRACPDDAAFAQLKMAVVGAEACPASLQQQFTERFGVPLLPGYGATELGPFVCCGQPDGNRDGVFELGCAEGSVGRAAPGVAVEVLNPETMEPCYAARKACWWSIRQPALIATSMTKNAARKPCMGLATSLATWVRLMTLVLLP